MNATKTSRSESLFADAKKYFVDGVASSLHKSPNEDFPLYFEKAQGCRVWDVDGNEYIDYVAGFGPLLLGHTPESIQRAVIDQIQRGILFAAPTETLNAVSKKLTEIIPCAESVCYQTTGTEANMLACRIARAYTSKEKIVRFEGHYHGWSDEELISNDADSLKMMGPRSAPWKTFGSPGQMASSGENIIVLPWNDLEAIKRTLARQRNEIAAVITEPVMCNCEVVFPAPGFLEKLRELTEQNEELLIFDETITGFRLSLGGAQEYFNVIPDLAVFGKAIASGFPLSAVVGSRKVIESGVHPRGTFNGNPVSIAACAATLKELEKPGTYTRLEEVAGELVQSIKRISSQKGAALYCDNVGSIVQLAFGIEKRLLDYRDTFRVKKNEYQSLRLKLLAQGVRLHPLRGREYICLAHSESDIRLTVDSINKLL